MVSDRELVFVYGTLRQGGSRAIPGLFPDAELIGFGSLRGVLYDFGAYPGLVIGDGPESVAVVGEVYRVSQAALRRMDRIEEFDKRDVEGSHYWRRRCTIQLQDGGQCEAWVYECNPRHFQLSRRITSGDWIAYVRAKRYAT
ncbi:MAG: gamma-glutamylcyclotransferase [Thermoflexales bacterium]